jgi:hypothetical protein
MATAPTPPIQHLVVILGVITLEVAAIVVGVVAAASAVAAAMDVQEVMATAQYANSMARKGI